MNVVRSIPGRISGRSVGPARLLVLALLATLLALPACTVRYVAEYDPRIEETSIVLQREMDSFLTSLEIAELEEDRSYDARREFYANYAVDLRSLRVRAAAQPLNDITIQQLDLMVSSLETLRTLHEEQGELSDAALGVNRELFNTAWGAILAWESQKKRGKSE